MKERHKAKLLKSLLKVKGIILYEPTKLASRQISEYYVDIKRSYGESRVLSKYANFILSSLGYEIQNISCVVGSGYGGIPLAVALFARMEIWNIKLSLIRDIPKGHGRPTMIDGYPIEELDKRKKLLIVDDVFTTGGSIKKIIEILPEDQKFEIFVVCNRSGIKEPEINGVKVNYILTPEDLMQGSCNECRGGGCFPPRQPGCVANKIFPIPEKLKKTLST